MISKLLRPNRIWSIGIYVEDLAFRFQDRLGMPRFVRDSKTLRRNQAHVHTYADPFLFPFGDELFLFFESQAVGENGSIAAYKTSNLVDFVPVGSILKEPFHISYPFVFANEGLIYMIPESAAISEVMLYKFDCFPHTLRRQRTLLRGRMYLDSSLIFHRRLWFLFTTSPAGLEIYYTDDIENGSMVPHSKNPITDCRKFDRNGGGPVQLDGQMYRIAQDGSLGYGRNIHILKINELSEDRYDEEIVVENYFDLRESWNSKGGHHMSFADFGGKRIIAVDGLQNDLFVNKLLALLQRF